MRNSWIQQKRGARIMRSPKNDRTYDGRVYDSKYEAKRAKELDVLIRIGDIYTWIPQVKFQLGYDFSTKVDFLVFKKYDDGSMAVWCEEVKGMESERFKTIRRLWVKYAPFEMQILKPQGQTWKRETIKREQLDLHRIDAAD